MGKSKQEIGRRTFDFISASFALDQSGHIAYGQWRRSASIGEARGEGWESSGKAKRKDWGRRGEARHDVPVPAIRDRSPGSFRHTKIVFAIARRKFPIAI
jgi:hypothetical protein